MAARKAHDSRPAPPIVIYAPLGELKVYEISEAELEKLATGAPGQLHLNFALAMLPAALTLLITLQTTTIASDRLYIGYQVAFWALAVQGLISLFLWRRSNHDFGKLVEEIRARMPREPVVPEQIVSSLLTVETATDQKGNVEA